MTEGTLVVVNFRVNHAPMVLTGATREMQENGTPAKCSLYVTTSFWSLLFINSPQQNIARNNS